MKAEYGRARTGYNAVGFGGRRGFCGIRLILVVLALNIDDGIVVFTVRAPAPQAHSRRSGICASNISNLPFSDRRL
jgi:hypothetical protein